MTVPVFTLGACRLIVVNTLNLFSGTDPGTQAVEIASVALQADHYYELRTEVTIYAERGGPASLAAVGWTYALQVDPAEYQLANWSSTERWASQRVDNSDRPGDPPVIGVERGPLVWAHDHDLGAAVRPQTFPADEPLFGLRVEASEPAPPDGAVAWHHQGRASFLTSRAYGGARLALVLRRDSPVGSVFSTWYPSVHVTECPYTTSAGAALLINGYEPLQ